VNIEERLDKIEELLAALLQKESAKDWYSTAEVARILGRSEFTVREWARLGRVRAEKRFSGRGPHTAWVISHAELLRFQREGLLPTQKHA
jgi:transposase